MVSPQEDKTVEAPSGRVEDDASEDLKYLDGLNRDLHALLNIPPRKVTWEIFNQDESATCMSSEYKEKAEERLAEVIRRFPDSWMRDHHVGRMDHWHRMANSWEGMGVLIDALEMQGWSWWLQGSTNWPKTATVGEWKSTARTAPLAMAQAALAALKAEGPEASEGSPSPSLETQP